MADSLIAWLRPSPAQIGAYRLFAALVPIALWSAYFTVVAIVWGTWWTVNLVGGAMVMSSLAGAGLAALMAPSPSDGWALARGLTSRCGDHDRWSPGCALDYLGQPVPACCGHLHRRVATAEAARISTPVVAAPIFRWAHAMVWVVLAGSCFLRTTDWAGAPDGANALALLAVPLYAIFVVTFVTDRKLNR